MLGKLQYCSGQRLRGENLITDPHYKPFVPIHIHVHAHIQFKQQQPKVIKLQCKSSKNEMTPV